MEGVASPGVGTYGWHKIVKSVTGWHPESEFLPAIIAAFILYMSVYFIGVFLYQTTKLIVPSAIKGYVLDFVKTMTFCAYPFGHGIMRKYYGEPGYIGAMLPVMYLSHFTFQSGDGNPISVWIKYFRKHIPVWKCIVKTVIQIFGGFAAYHLGMFILGLEIHPMYIERLKDYYKSFCSTDLNVPAYLGFAIEFLAVIYDSWFSSQTLTGNQPVDTVIKITNSGLLVVAGVHLTGMYIHPAMATGHTWGCGDTTRTSHILIYWIGPMIGVWLSIELQKRFSLRKPVKASATGKPKSRAKGSQPQPQTNGMVENKKKQNGHRRRFYHGKKIN